MSKDKANYSTIRNRIAKEYKDKIDELTAENKKLRSIVVKHEELLKAVENERDKLKKENLLLKVFHKFTESDLRYIDLLTGDNSVLGSVLGKRGLLGGTSLAHTPTTNAIMEALGKMI